MTIDREFKARDKKTHKMTRDGLIEFNETTGEEVRVSQRGQEFQLRQTQPDQDARTDFRHLDSVRGAIADYANTRSGHRRRQQSPPSGAQPDAPQTDPARQEDGEMQPSGEQPETTGQSMKAPANSVPELSPANNGREASRTDAPPPDQPRGSQRDAAYRFHMETAHPVEQSFTQETPPGSVPQDDAGARRGERPPPPDQPRGSQRDAAYRFHREAAHPAEQNFTQGIPPGPISQDGTGTHQSERPSPLTERPGRLRFDHEQRASFGSDKQQRGQKPSAGTEYHRRFMEDAARQPEAEHTRTDPLDSENVPQPVSYADETSRPNRRAEPEGSRHSDAASSKKNRLQFSPEEQSARQPASSGDSAPKNLNKKLDKARNKAEKSAVKLDKARAKLPTRRRPRLEQTVDAEAGRTQRRLHFEKEIKSQHQHLKGSLPLRPVKLGANAAVGYAHKKIYQVEHENVGTEAAHKAEIMAEGAVRSAYHLHKTRPYRKVARLERKATKRAVKFSYQKALHDNPKLKSNIFSRMAQKRKIKKQYAKAARDAKRAGRTLGKAGDILVKIARSAASLVIKHPAVFGAIAALLLVVFIFMTMLSSCSNMAMGGLSATLASSYLAADADINDADLIYTQWENELREEIENVETDHPDYDEYNYDLDEIGHDPRRLMAYLTAVYHDFRYADVYDVLREIFEEQYTLEFEEEVEVRYADPYDSDDDGDTEPYDYYILNITLTAKPFPDVLAPRMDSGQTEIHDLILESGGNRQYVLSPFDFDWTPYISSYFGYRVHPITGATDFHTGIDIAVASGTSILAAHDGVVTSAVYGATGYGYQLVISGDNGISTRYAHCDVLLAAAGQEVKKGDVIARVGTTGDSTGPHLHFEVIKDGGFLNPLYFAATDINP